MRKQSNAATPAKTGQKAAALRKPSPKSPKARTVANAKRNKAALAKAQVITAQTYDARKGVAALAKGVAASEAAGQKALQALWSQLLDLGLAGTGDNVRRLSYAEAGKAFRPQVAEAFAKANTGGHLPGGKRWADATVKNYVTFTVTSLFAMSQGSCTVKGVKVDLTPQPQEHLQSYYSRVNRLTRDAGLRKTSGGGSKPKGGAGDKPGQPSAPKTHRELQAQVNADTVVLIRYFGTAERVALLRMAMTEEKERLDKFLAALAAERGGGNA